MEGSMGKVGEQTAYIYAVAIVITILALAISTRFSLRNLLNIHAVSDPVSSKEFKVGTHDACPYDAAGNDGDDEAEPELEDVTARNDVSHRHKIPPRYTDPVEYCEHIQGEIKYIQQSLAAQTNRKSLSEQQMLEEKEVQCRQLAEIFQIMQAQQDQFGVGSLDDVQEQMKLYAV